MNSRLIQFLNAENITQAQFADSIGVTRPSISHIISGRNKPSYEFISATMRKYPRLNPEWLILGKGRMYNDSGRQTPQANDFSGEDLLFPTDFDSSERPTPSLEQPQQMAPVPSRMNSAEPSLNATVPEKTTAMAPQNEVPSSGRPPVFRDSPVTAATAQRRVSKIIVFFDDGTFQEMRG